MTAPNPRPSIASITVTFSDGTPDLVLSGSALTDPKGGVLIWNEYGVGVLEHHYNATQEPEKGQKARQLWNDGAALLTKPNCIPACYP